MASALDTCPLLDALLCLQDRVASLSAAVQQICKSCTDQVFILALEACDHFLECLLAVTALGGIAAPFNLRWGQREVTAALQTCKPLAVFADAAGLKLLADQPLIAGIPTIHISPGQLPSGSSPSDQLSQLSGPVYALEDLIHQHREALLQPVGSSSGAALICFTSGSTGQPKGALISHTALHCQGMAKAVQLRYCRQDTYLHCLPLFHIGGLSSMLAMLMVGAMQVWMADCLCARQRLF